ncbi:MAG: amidase [Erythrobacter sp.]|jgi:amidase|nr:amidase [Erythrobacter sp.]
MICQRSWPRLARSLALAAPLALSASIALADETTGAFDAEADIARRIEAIERHDNGADGINAVIIHSLTAGFKAREAAAIGPLNGRSVLVKDNIETAEWATTGGSLALGANFTRRDAPLIANLRRAGGVVLGKTNLSEWANIRSSDSTSGWSAVGGLTRNPHAIDRNACGSSSGSGAAVAAGMAWAAIGTETNGSITCPASINGIVGFKPSVGIVSRRHVIPISATQDTAGPMTRTVYDAALLLTAMAGEDESDPVTLTARRMPDYTAGLDQASLAGVRIGVLRKQAGTRPDVAALFEAALADLERAGAVLVELDYETPGEFWRSTTPVLLFELREEMAAYLESLPGDGLPRSLADLVAFNRANADRELRWFGQDLFERALATTDRAQYEANLETIRRLTREEGIDRLIAQHDVRLLVAPTTGPAWSIDLINGDNFAGRIGAGYLPAIAGYPHLTVPMGAIEGLPIGLSFIGAQWEDHAVLKAGATYERARTAKLPAPSFKRWSPAP